MITLFLFLTPQRFPAWCPRFLMFSFQNCCSLNCRSTSLSSLNKTDAAGRKIERYTFWAWREWTNLPARLLRATEQAMWGFFPFLRAQLSCVAKWHAAALMCWWLVHGGNIFNFWGAKVSWLKMHEKSGFCAKACICLGYVLYEKKIETNLVMHWCCDGTVNFLECQHHRIIYGVAHLHWSLESRRGIAVLASRGPFDFSSWDFRFMSMKIGI